MFGKAEELIKSINELKEMLYKIITFPETFFSWCKAFKESLWSLLEIATAIVIIGLLVSMIDRKIGFKIIRYTIVIYFIFELILGLM